MAKKKKIKLSNVLEPQPLAKTFSVIYGVYLLLAALIPALGFDFLWWNTRALAALAAFYPGVAPTFLGALIGLIWGVVSGAIFGLVVAWLYNKFKS